jgi:hypothetical protein
LIVDFEVSASNAWIKLSDRGRDGNLKSPFMDLPDAGITRL